MGAHDQVIYRCVRERRQQVTEIVIEGRVVLHRGGRMTVPGMVLRE